MRLYLIGSLRNELVPELAHMLRLDGHDVFDDWYAAGPEADDYWQKYEKDRDRNFAQALNGYAAHHVFEYDRTHLDRSEGAVLLMPAGKSSHLELGYILGQGKPGWILMHGEPERFDVMYRFATEVVYTVDDLLEEINRYVAPGKNLHGHGEIEIVGRRGVSNPHSARSSEGGDRAHSYEAPTE